MTFLDKILQGRKVPARKRRSLVAALKKDGLTVIAEVKKASPSEGRLNDVDAAQTALMYEAAGAGAVSVLTEEKHFKGSLQDLKEVKEAVGIPVLRKDFIVDEFQLHEALVYGADAVLLIATLLKEKTKKYVKKAHSLGLECLVEVHDEAELKYALDSGAKMIGINNRNLSTLEVELGTTERIAPLVPKDRLIVAESGVKSKADADRMRAAGVDAILVGSALMKADDPKKKLGEILG